MKLPFREGGSEMGRERFVEVSLQFIKRFVVLVLRFIAVQIGPFLS